MMNRVHMPFSSPNLVTLTSPKFIVFLLAVMGTESGVLGMLQKHCAHWAIAPGQLLHFAQKVLEKWNRWRQGQK